MEPRTQKTHNRTTQKTKKMTNTVMLKNIKMISTNKFKMKQKYQPRITEINKVVRSHHLNLTCMKNLPFKISL